MPLAVDLPDVNVWLAAGVPDHVHHERARHYWRHEATPRVVFCRITCLGYVRLITNKSAMQGNPVTVPEAWVAYQALRQLPEIGFAPEPEGCETLLAGWAAEGRFSSRHWTDVYLAAFARAADYRIVSFDEGFARFDGLRLLRLVP